MPVSERVKNIAPSKTLAVSALAKQMKKSGIDVVSLGAGEPDFPTPKEIGDFGIKAITQGKTHYTDVSGTLELRDAISEKLLRDNNLKFSANEIIVSNGAKQSIFNAIATLVNPGEEVIITAPYWVSYPEMIKINGGIVKICQPSSGIKPTADDIKKCITEKTKLIIINSPNNPAGYCLNKEELTKIGNLLENHKNIYILSDEIYEYLTWTDEPFSNLANTNPNLIERTIIINGVSKNYAMTGWRIGYSACKNQTINAAMKTYQSQTTSCPSSVSQFASIKAMNTLKSDLTNMLDIYRKRREIMYFELNKIKGVKAQPSEGAFYSFPDFSEYIKILGMKDDYELAEMLLKNAHVAVVPGSAFGFKNHIRLSFATSDENINIAISRINEQIQ